MNNISSIYVEFWPIYISFNLFRDEIKKFLYLFHQQILIEWSSFYIFLNIRLKTHCSIKISQWLIFIADLNIHESKGKPKIVTIIKHRVSWFQSSFFNQFLIYWNEFLDIYYPTIEMPMQLPNGSVDFCAIANGVVVVIVIHWLQQCHKCRVLLTIYLCNSNS